MRSTLSLMGLAFCMIASPGPLRAEDPASPASPPGLHGSLLEELGSAASARADLGVAEPLAATIVPDDRFWGEGFGWPGVNGAVWAITSFRGDLIIGGEFTEAGGVPVNRIARWDGMTWRPLGQGVFRTGSFETPVVTSLAVYNDTLVVAGSFDLAGSANARNIARWDGVAWAPLGAGINHAVECLAVWNGGVVAGGDFTFAGGVPAPGIAMWKDDAWAGLGGGVNGEVTVLTAHAGDLIAAGSFTMAGGVGVDRLARWNGSAWSAFPSVPSGGVAGRFMSLATYRGELIAAGYFNQTEGTPTPGIAAWNGSSWRSLGTGLGGYGFALAVTNDRLFVGGQFAFAGSVAVNGIAAWDGATWSALATRTRRTGGSSMPMVVKRLGTWSGSLVVAGDFDVAEEVMAVRLGRWDGVGWRPFGWGLSDNYYLSLASCFAEYNGRLIIGGRLSHNQTSPLPSVDLRAWDGETMDVFEWRMSDLQTPNVNALAVYHGDLIAAGSFTEAGGVAANRIARWDGGQWQPLGDGANGTIEALAVWRDELIAAGWFTEIGGVPASRVARWNGSSWSPLGAGVSDVAAAIAEFGGDLIVAGFFTRAGGDSARRIARWDGTAWRPLDDGLSAGVRALAVYDGDLIVSGHFLKAGSSAVNYVARWNGATWTSLGAGMDNGVYALAVHGTELVAGGAFSRAGDSLALAVARWDGAAWHPMGSGLWDTVLRGALVYGFHTFQGRLFVGGHFDRAGGMPAYNIVPWSGTPAPRVPRPPLAFESNFPNPFGAATTFTFKLGAPGPARLRLHDLQGRVVATVAEGTYPAGVNVVTWQARGDRGLALRSGIYVARLEANGTATARKVVVVR